jgi:Major Facilitator Superfamily
MANTSNGVLYGFFAFSALMAGSVLNTLGPRLTMLFGITGYPVYIGAMWYYDSYGHMWYPIFAGAYLGLTAGCLWTTATYTANAYAEEKEKGLFRAIQWVGNVCGSAVGASVALGVSWNSASLSVPHSVYIIFIVIQCCSVIFALLLLPSDRLRRADGTALAAFPRISLWDSIKMTMGLFKDWRIVLMIPVCFTPEMFFPFQSSMNAYAFDLRTRTLNSLLNNLIQIPVTLFVGFLLDTNRIKSRKTRAFLGITFDAIWITGAYIAQTIWLSSWKFNRSVAGPSIDCTDSSYAGAVVIYMLYAAQYGMFQNVVIYVLGTLTNDPYKSATIGGFFVGCELNLKYPFTFWTLLTNFFNSQGSVLAQPCHLASTRLRSHMRTKTPPTLHSQLCVGQSYTTSFGNLQMIRTILKKTVSSPPYMPELLSRLRVWPLLLKRMLKLLLRFLYLVSQRNRKWDRLNICYQYARSMRGERRVLRDSIFDRMNIWVDCI